MSPLSGYTPLLQFWHFNKGIIIIIMFPVTFCTEVIIRAILRCGNHLKSFFRILQWLSECPLTAALFRTRITRAISLNLLLTRLLGSNNSNSKVKTLQTPISTVALFFYFNKKLIFYHFLIICTCHTYISFSELFPIKYVNK